ncbi:MAG: hypothetical protein PHS34_09130 [Candidatus Omnitrophica bacterium]|nr:hypothetical protein [Candidatus Omnitrophota bacterium]
MKRQISQAGQTIVVTAARAPRWFWYIVAGIALILIIYFYGKRKGKSTPIKIKLPGGTSDIPTGWNPNPLIEDLHDVLDSTTFSPVAWNKREEVFSELLNLATDSMFVFINNEYNKRYQGEMTRSLKEQIRREGMLGFWAGLKDKLIERMDKLNIV